MKNFDIGNFFPNPLENFMRDHQKRLDETIKMSQNAYEQKQKERFEEKEWRDKLLSETQQTHAALEQTNEILRNKLTAVNTTLDFILNSMGGNFQHIERTQLILDKRIQEIAKLVSEKDSNGLKEYIKEHGLEAIGTILSFVSFLSQ